VWRLPGFVYGVRVTALIRCALTLSLVPWGLLLRPGALFMAPLALIFVLLVGALAPADLKQTGICEQAQAQAHSHPGSPPA
jgi:hypothetical protein